MVTWYYIILHGNLILYYQSIKESIARSPVVPRKQVFNKNEIQCFIKHDEGNKQTGLPTKDGTEKTTVHNRRDWKDDCT